MHFSYIILSLEHVINFFKNLLYNTYIDPINNSFNTYPCIAHVA